MEDDWCVHFGDLCIQIKMYVKLIVNLHFAPFLKKDSKTNKFRIIRGTYFEQIVD